MLLYHCSDWEIDGCHYLVAHFYNAYLKPYVMEVLCHFEADKTGTYYYGLCCFALLNIILDVVSIINIA